MLSLFPPSRAVTQFAEADSKQPLTRVGIIESLAPRRSQVVWTGSGLRPRPVAFPSRLVVVPPGGLRNITGVGDA
jgi:hypothetical protein